MQKNGFLAITAKLFVSLPQNFACMDLISTCTCKKRSNDSKTQNYCSKIRKQGCKILSFQTPQDILSCYRQTLCASGPKICIQVAKHRGHIHAKFQALYQINSRFLGQKSLKNAQKMQKKLSFDHISQTMSLTIIRFCMHGLDLNMYLHEKFHWPEVSPFSITQF